MFQDAPKGFNLVTLTDTTATAVLQEDGSIYCQPDVLFEGWLLIVLVSVTTLAICWI